MSSYDIFCKTLSNLQTCREEKEPYSVVIQAGILGLFDICFKYCLKMMKEVLESNGIVQNKIGSPKIIIKTAYQARMINDEQGWLDLLNTRNILAHTYSDDAVLTAINQIKTEYIGIFEDLKKEVDENWL